MIKSLRWVDSPGLSGGPNITIVYARGVQEETEEAMTEEARTEAVTGAVNSEDGGRHCKSRNASGHRSWKGQGEEFLLRACGRNQSCV